MLAIRDGGIRIIPATERRRGEAGYEQRTIWYEGEALAAPEMLYLLRRAYPDKEVQITGASDLAADGEWHRCNLILLGGPSSNLVTQQVMESGMFAQLPYSFSESALNDVDGRELCRWRQTEAHVVDGAVVVRGRSPFASGRIVVLMMGIETQGVCAAAACLESQEWLRLVAPCAMHLPSFHASWEVRAGLNDPWPIDGTFLAPIKALEGESCS